MVYLRRFVTVAALATFLASQAIASPFMVAPTVQPQAPLLASVDAEVIPDNYVIVLKKNASTDAVRSHLALISMMVKHQLPETVNTIMASPNRRGKQQRTFAAFPAAAENWSGTKGNRIKHVYDIEGLKGYAGRFDAETLDQIRSLPEVDYVERDAVVYATDTQVNAPWGLARISHRPKLSLGTFNRYEYHPNGGEGVTVFVVDTGINTEHEDFEGRAVWSDVVPDGDPTQIDGNGHGTHVAGTIAGKRFGVAKKANLVAVKVLGSNGSGSLSDVIRGIEYTIAGHREELEKAKSEGKVYKGSVANMSLGAGYNKALNQATDAAVDNGVHFAVAAGNDNRDACDYSPASAEKAITVGASTLGDERAFFSNFGKCVDIFSPGLSIMSAWIGSNKATNTISGTSMASPHSAGQLAVLLSQAEKPLTTDELKALVLSTATKDAIKGLDGESPNLLSFIAPPSSK
ncbi:serine protease 1 [Ramicandelaber brevisporus]|nr:serine protease 1 [Ramicandelaber brevisporus]